VRRVAPSRLSRTRFTDRLSSTIGPNKACGGINYMEVRIVNVPETKVAVLEHRGSPEAERESIAKYVAWR